MKVGVIGCGFQGRLHIQFLSQIPDVTVIAVADINLEAAESVSREFGVANCYTDFRQLLDSHQFDLVTVCTMPVHHAEMTIAALQSGAHVLCEKPLALNAAEGSDMVAAARQAGRILAVGFNMRFTPNAMAIASFIDDGGLGRPIYTRAWAKASQIPWWGEHYRREISGGGALAATAIHFLDLALYFAGFPEPKSASASMARVFPAKRSTTAPSAEVSARFDAEDLFSSHIRFKNGFFLTLEGSWIDNRPSVQGVPSWDYSLDAVGESAQVWFDPLAIRGEDHSGDIVDLLPEGVSSDVSFPPSVQRLINDVVDACRENRTPCVTGDQALAVQRIVDAIYLSAETGNEQSVELSEVSG